MRPSIPVRAWVQRVLRLGPSRLALILAILLALISLGLPFWSLAFVSGTDQYVGTFSWGTTTTDHYRNGAWDGTTILPYASSQPVLAQFSFRSVGGALGAAYILVVVFLIVAAVVLALFTMEQSRTMPTLTLLVVSLLVVGIGLLAVFYPLVTAPGAATTDVGIFTVNGFWGGIRTTGPTRDWSWGPALGWWMFLLSVLLGIVGAALPYLKSVRSTTPPPPSDWRPTR